MTDCEIILQILSDGKPHNVIEIMQRGKPGCINWAVRSRISDLKKKGHNIRSWIDRNGQAVYQLLPAVKYDSEGQGILIYGQPITKNINY